MPEPQACPVQDQSPLTEGLSRKSRWEMAMCRPGVTKEQG